MNLVVGDRVAWTAPKFVGGSFFRGRCSGAQCVGEETFSGVIERDSYGEGTGQHTFTIRLDNGSTKRVMGRNLYGRVTDYTPGPNHAEAEAAKAARVQLAVETAGCLSNLPARLRG